MQYQGKSTTRHWERINLFPTYRRRVTPLTSAWLKPATFPSEVNRYLLYTGGTPARLSGRAVAWPITIRVIAV